MNNKTLKTIIITDLFILLFLVSLFVPITDSQTWTIDKESISEKNDFDNIQISEVFTNEYRQKDNIFNGPMSSAWPMFGHDARHTGRSPYSTENNSGVELWRFRAEIGIESSPAIDQDGIIYFGSNEHYLHALYPNGTEKWRTDCGHWVTSSPAIAEDGTVYVGSWDGHLYSINPDGSEKWRFYTVDTVRSPPAIGEDGVIYFGVLGPGTNIGRVYALYPNGTEKWHFDTGFWIYKSPAIDNNGIVYISSEDNHLYALYPNNGTCKWSYGFGDWPGHPSIGDYGTIYVSSWDGYLYSIYPNGTLCWRHSIDWGTGHAPAIGNDGTIYIGQRYFYAIYPNGTRKWTYNFGYDWEVSTSTAISADGTIYFGITNSPSRADLVALNSDGTLRWRVEGIANDWVHSSPAISEDGVVYIGSTSADTTPYGYIYAFGEGNRQPDRPSISGEANGRFGESYDYTFVSSDYEEGEVWYYIDWGDDTIEDWFGPYDSGEEVVMSHTWDKRGTYTLRAKAKDALDEESSWGTLEVSMPVNQPVQFPIIQWFLERFPNTFPVLRNLLEL